MKALYIGILTEGTTSKMRSDTLRGLIPRAHWDVIDTDAGFRKATRLSKTMAFRTKAGSLVSQINKQVINNTADEQYDLIWIDKAVYLWPKTVAHLRARAHRMVHFTPDTAFFANRSRHFFASASRYDLLATTKSFELAKYNQLTDMNRVYLTTQAYDADLHRPPEENLGRLQAAVFIGLCEPDRENCMKVLLAATVPIRVGGRGWENFMKRHSSHPGLHYLGKDVFGDKYVSEYNAASVGLGLLSKRFPELHTTRTFEIPACGAMLATEKTAETAEIFCEDEVLFFDDYQQLASRLSELMKNPEKIEEISMKGHQRVLADGYDYTSVLSGVLNRLSIPT